MQRASLYCKDLIALLQTTVCSTAKSCLLHCKFTIHSARLCLTLPLPPSINEQYATVNGHRVLTAVARRFKGAVQKQVKDLKLEGKLSDQCLSCLQSGYLAIYLRFYFGSPLKRDLDGPLKI
jgi:crossover junction endodeoxyribonuclease RusA